MRVIDFFDNGTKYYPDNIAFIDIDAGDSKTTYREAWEKSHKIAAAIRANGYEAGTHIGVLSPNSAECFITLLGLFRSRAYWLPINPRNAVAVNIDLLTRFDGEVLIYHSSYEEEAAQIVEGVPGIKKAICMDREGECGPSLSTFMQGCPETFVDTDEIDLEELMAIYPSGGTTGKSKGVMVTHRVVYTLYNSLYSHFNYYNNTAYLIAAPMTHTGALFGSAHFARGGTNVITNKADPVKIPGYIERYRITHLFLPPTVLYMMLAQPDIRDHDYSSLQHFIVAAAPTAYDKLLEAIDVFGPVMTELYGQAEAPAAVTAKAPWDYLDEKGNIIESRLRSAGRPCNNNQVAILDDEGNEVPRGTPGEICVKGQLVTLGYYKNAEETEKARRFGWHHTDDIGVMDEEGFITVVDRKKDMIISGGFNIYPNEIEQVVNQHPAVQECSVIGVPDEKWGEALKAVVQCKQGMECNEEELIRLVKDSLGGFKAPKSVDFVADLPRSSNGKVLKTELRKKYWANKKRDVN